jgi:hypothetical protein
MVLIDGEVAGATRKLLATAQPQRLLLRPGPRERKVPSRDAFFLNGSRVPYICNTPPPIDFRIGLDI